MCPIVWTVVRANRLINLMIFSWIFCILLIINIIFTDIIHLNCWASIELKTILHEYFPMDCLKLKVSIKILRRWRAFHVSFKYFILKKAVTCNAVSWSKSCMDWAKEHTRSIECHSNLRPRDGLTTFYENIYCFSYCKTSREFYVRTRYPFSSILQSQFAWIDAFLGGEHWLFYVIGTLLYDETRDEL